MCSAYYCICRAMCIALLVRSYRIHAVCVTYMYKQLISCVPYSIALRTLLRACFQLFC